MIPPTTRPIPIDTDLEVLVGLTCNFALTTNGLFLNLDQSFGIFYKPHPLIELVRDFCANNRRYRTVDAPTYEFFYHFEQQVKKLKIETMHRGEKDKKLIMSGLVNETARDKMLKFNNRDNSTEDEMSVAVYLVAVLRAEAPESPTCGNQGQEPATLLPNVCTWDRTNAEVHAKVEQGIDSVHDQDSNQETSRQVRTDQEQGRGTPGIQEYNTRRIWNYV